jgi:hypothetical protein
MFIISTELVEVVDRRLHKESATLFRLYLTIQTIHCEWVLSSLARVGCDQSVKMKVTTPLFNQDVLSLCPYGAKATGERPDPVGTYNDELPALK